MENRVFLGGTCNETTWRDKLIPLLVIDYFNPVVKDWTPECQEIERQEKEKCNIHLYVITNSMTGVFSIAEAVDSAHNKEIETIFYVFPDGFNPGQLHSLMAVITLIKSRNGIGVIDNKIERVAMLINKLAITKA